MEIHKGTLTEAPMITLVVVVSHITRVVAAEVQVEEGVMVVMAEVEVGVAMEVAPGTTQALLMVEAKVTVAPKGMAEVKDMEEAEVVVVVMAAMVGNSSTTTLREGTVIILRVEADVVAETLTGGEHEVRLSC